MHSDKGPIIYLGWGLTLRFDNEYSSGWQNGSYGTYDASGNRREVWSTDSDDREKRMHLCEEYGSGVEVGLLEVLLMSFDERSYMLDEIASTVGAEALSRAIDWTQATIADRRKQKKVQALLDETAMRAAMVKTSMDLGARFKNTHLVEELLAHHQLADIPKNEAIETFLGEGSDDASVIFVSEFYDEVTDIMATAEESRTSRKTLDRVNEGNAKLAAIYNRLEESGGDAVAQIVLLRELMGLVTTSQEDDVERIRKLADDTGNSLASSYLRAYVALCCGETVDHPRIEQIRGHDELIEALCSVGVSAGRPDDVDKILELLSFDGSGLANPLRILTEAPRATYEPAEVRVPEGKNIDGLVGLANFEKAYGLAGYHAAVSLAQTTQIAWNPIAREKLLISRLISEAMFNCENMMNEAVAFTGSYRSWFTEELTEQYEKAISIALTRLNVDSASEVLNAVPEELGTFVQDERKELQLRSCGDAKGALSVAAWAEARQNPALLIAAAVKSIEIDEGTRDELIPVFERGKGWAFPHAGVFSLYASEVNPDISYEDYLRLGQGVNNEAAFHLTAYSKFRNSNPDIAKGHIEAALQIMKASGSPEFTYSFVWVRYLVANGREEEVIHLVQRVLPLAPVDMLQPFLSAVAHSGSEDGLLDRVIDMTLQAEFEDPAAAEMIAGYLARQGEEGLAGRMALRAFHKRPSEGLAEIATQWMLDSSLAVDDEIVAYAEDRDTPRMNLLMANVMKQRGSKQQSNSYLIRAAFCDEKVSPRALMLYATWNTGNDDGTAEEPVEVGPDTSVLMTNAAGERTTYIFLSDSRSVRKDGGRGPAGASFGLKSAMFLILRGSRIGDTVSIAGVERTVSNIERAANALARAGFAELPNIPGTKVIKGSPEEAIAQIVEIAKSSSRKNDVYNEGIPTDAGTIYLGIETGCPMGASRQLEFTIAAVKNPNMPYRRAQPSRNFAPSQMDKFLLSYNAIVVLSLLGIPEEVRRAVIEKCVVTASTAERLQQDALGLMNEVYVGSGRLSVQDDRPILLEFGDETKKDIKERAITINDLLGSLEVVDPVLNTPTATHSHLLSDNESIDIETAGRRGYAFVTEDILEAQIIDTCKASKRCSLTFLLLWLGFVGYALRDFSNKMREWRAEPVLEADIINAGS